MKKEFKKRLKADEFISLVNNAINYAKSHLKQVVAAVGTVVVLILIFLGVKYIQAQNLKKESLLLSQIITLTDELQTNPEKLTELEALGGKGKFARLAFLNAATFSYEQGDMDKTLSTLDKIPSANKDIIYYQSLNVKAQVFIMQKKYDEALNILQQIEADEPVEYALDSVLFSLAEIYQEKGDAEQALVYFTRLKDEFPQTYYGYEASQELTKLEAKK